MLINNIIYFNKSLDKFNHKNYIKMNNKTKYENVFIKCFSIKKDVLKKKDLKYNTIDKWDSVGHMSMIGKLEDTFNITFEMDDIIDFSSFNKGIKILKKYKVII